MSVIAMVGVGTDWAAFLGRFHPLLVHAPIGLLGAVVLAELCGASLKKPMEAPVRRVLYAAAALSALASAGAGWLLAEGGGYDSSLLFLHRWLGIAVAGILVVCVLLAFREKSKLYRWRWGGMVVAGGLMTIAGHQGGSLTHGEGFLTRHAPWNTSSNETALALERIDLSPDAAATLAMFEARCVECHGASKQKGNLRLDEAAGISSVVTAGDPGASELMRRITLPGGHEDAMPPEGGAVDERTILAVMRWIRGGARLGAVEQGLSDRAERESQEVERLDEVRALTGAEIDEAVPGEPELLRVDFSNTPGEIVADRLGALSLIAGRVVELSLAGKAFDAEALAGLGTLERVERAHFERSGVTDEGLVLILANTPSLRYLNLHSTAVSDRAMGSIGELEHLDRLVLFETGVSPEALSAFAADHPEVRVTGELILPVAVFENRTPRLILAADASAGRIALLREVAIGHPETVWEHEIGDLHDLHLLESGNVLFQTSWTRLVEVNPDTGETVWEYDAAVMNRSEPGERVEVHAFERRADGTTMIAESGPARIIEVARDGTVLSQTPLAVDSPDVHHDTRLVRTTPTGTYLVAHEKDGVVREYARDGSVVWEYDVPAGEADGGDQAFSAVRLASGNTLIGTGNGHAVIEVNPAGETVWSVSPDELDGVTLAWVTTVQELSNGNLVIGNCHAGEGQPQIIEITREKQVVWRFEDFTRFGNALSNSLIIEDTDRAHQ